MEGIETSGLTPMMAQYAEIKAAHPGTILLFRLGDFYEMFFDDARQISRLLGLALTRRGQSNQEDVPMCGIPFHALDGYAARMLQAGHRLAICEQIAGTGQAKGPMRREVVRILTPGTVVEESLSDPRRPICLAALTMTPTSGVLAWIDLGAGTSGWAEGVPDSLWDVLVRLGPAEIIVPDTVADRWRARLSSWPTVPLPPGAFSPDWGLARMQAVWGMLVESLPHVAATFGAILQYLNQVQGPVLPALSPPVRTGTGVLHMDASTWTGLEIGASGRPGPHTVLGVLDRTRTAAGARMLSKRLCEVSTNATVIRAHQAPIAALLARPQDLPACQEALDRIPDIERAVTRLRMGRGGPRDLLSVAQGIQGHGVLAGHLPELAPELIVLAQRLQAALQLRVPMLTRDGGFIMAGVDPEIDRLRGTFDTHTQRLDALQAELSQRLGCPLKRKTHQGLGTLFEVPSALAETLKSQGWVERGVLIHRQSLSGHVRYATPDTIQMDADSAVARTGILQREAEMFEVLRTETLDHEPALRTLGGQLAALDVAVCMSVWVHQGGWILPEILDHPGFQVRQGRHPVVAAALGHRFTPNDCVLDDPQAWMLTGPNMAGKSTFLRQNALILLLAQAGLPVPAQEAAIGPADALLSRIGASDALAEGKSTFLMEMLETAHIVNQATDRSFVILDEVGRGTDPVEGQAIARACIEALAATGCRTLFATHYRQIAQPAPARVAPKKMEVDTQDEGLVFLHTVVDGVADGSLGLLIAERAGLPASVIARAQALLRAPPAEGVGLDTLDLDRMSPREALDWLYAAQRQVMPRLADG